MEIHPAVWKETRPCPACGFGVSLWETLLLPLQIAECACGKKLGLMWRVVPGEPDPLFWFEAVPSDNHEVPPGAAIRKGPNLARLHR